MAEYYVNPNPGYTSPISHGPHANMPHANMPHATQAAHANMMPQFTANAKALPAAVAPACAPGLSADAILVLFILLVIITRLCV